MISANIPAKQEIFIPASRFSFQRARFARHQVQNAVFIIRYVPFLVQYFINATHVARPFLEVYSVVERVDGCPDFAAMPLYLRKSSAFPGSVEYPTRLCRPFLSLATAPYSIPAS